MKFSFDYFLLLVIGYLTDISLGASCSSPEVKSKVYTTTDSQISAQTVIVIDFSIKCDNLKGLNLYAELNGRTIPITKHQTSDLFQVSFSGAHKKMHMGVHQIRFFDDQLYTELRKAQRLGTDTSSAKHLFAIDVSHKGASNESWLQGDVIAVLVAASVSYFAFNKKNNIHA